MTAWELTQHQVPVGMAQLPPHASVPRWALDQGYDAPYWSVTRTADELCVVCAWDAMPGTVTGAGPYTAFSIDGPLEHSLIGVLASLLDPLAAADISIMAGSTFDTDWILVPRGQAALAAEVWQRSGHTITLEELS